MDEYRSKRDFTRTSEPAQDVPPLEGAGPIFVVQEHWASHHHFDFRLETEGVLRSFAIPKGLPEAPGVRRLAIQTEDHPLVYAGFEGDIPDGQYGAGKVTIWDRGTYTPHKLLPDEMDVELHGKKLHGRYVLVRFKKGGENSFLVLKGEEK